MCQYVLAATNKNQPLTATEIGPQRANQFDAFRSGIVAANRISGNSQMSSEAPKFNLAISREQFDAFSEDEKYQLVQSLLGQLKNFADGAMAAIDAMPAKIDAMLRGGILADKDFLHDQINMEK
jgi:hypothetical protein